MRRSSGALKAMALAAVLSVLLITAQSCAPPADTEQTSWVMGTLVSIKCADEQAAREAMEALRQLEATVNAFEEGVNTAGFYPASESIDLSLDAAESVRELSGGAYNIAVYEAMLAWGLLENKWQETVEAKPLADALMQIAAQTAKLEITRKDGVYYFNEGAKITLGGVAKGAAGDAAARTLRSLGVERAIISLGGNIALVGNNNGKPWSVGITDPVTREPALKILAEDTTVTTAGAYQRYVIIDGVQYGHIIDPATAAPAEGEVLSATIICRDGAFADALATAVFVMGMREGMALVERIPEAEAILMLQDHTVIKSSGAPEIEVLGGGWQVEE